MRNNRDARIYDATHQYRIGRQRFGLVAVVVAAAAMSAAGLAATAIELSATVRPAATSAHGVAVGLSTRIRSGASDTPTSPTVPPSMASTATTVTRPATGSTSPSQTITTDPSTTATVPSTQQDYQIIGTAKLHSLTSLSTGALPQNVANAFFNQPHTFMPDGANGDPVATTVAAIAASKAAYPLASHAWLFNSFGPNFLTNAPGILGVFGPGGPYGPGQPNPPGLAAVQYDPEGQASNGTPQAEVDALGTGNLTYVQQAIALVHAKGLKFLFTPSADVGMTAGQGGFPNKYATWLSEGRGAWAAAGEDYYSIQSQQAEGTSAWTSFVPAALAQAHTAAPQIPTLIGIGINPHDPPTVITTQILFDAYNFGLANGAAGFWQNVEQGVNANVPPSVYVGFLNQVFGGSPLPTTTTPAPTTTAPAPTTTTRPGPGSGSGPKPRAGVLPAGPAVPIPAAVARGRKSRCKPDPAAAIAALPAGGVFNGSGCYKTAGILITKPVTLNGGTYDDSVKAESKGQVKAEGTTAKVEPIIRIKDTSHVTISNVVLNGRNLAGGYRGLPWVNEEGIRILSSANVTLDNVSANNTYGDGLILGFEPGHPPTTDLTVNGYTINKAGRQGVTMAYATASTLNDVTINSSADAGWDFESDLTGIGAGNITINRPGGSKGILMQGTLAGPVTLNDSHFSGDIGLVRDAARSGQPVTFNRGTIVMRNRFSGTPPAGIWVDGPGNLTFNGVTFARRPSDGPPKSGAWVALDGAHLTFDNSTVVAPLGANDPASTVTITP